MPPRRTPSRNGHARQQASPFNGWDPIMLNQLSMIANATSSSRRDLITRSIDPRRDIDDECGYPTGHSPVPVDFYRYLFDRFSIANRATHLLPKESWQGSPEIYEDEDPSKQTPFEEAWDSLETSLQSGTTWHNQESGGTVFDTLVRADILSGIGYFGVLLLGIDDGRPLQEPIDGVVTLNTRDCPPTQEERRLLENELDIRSEPFVVNGQQFEGKKVVNGWGYRPTKKEADYWDKVTDLIRNQATVFGTESQYDNSQSVSLMGTDAQYFGPQFYGSEQPADKPSKKKRKLLFIRAYDESLVQPVRYEWNINNPRFGMPIMYRITLNDPKTAHSGIGLPLATVYVHWTRVIHLADNLGASEVFGMPRQQPILNNLLDLRKIYGASGEGFWRNAFMKLSFETHPQLGGDVLIDEAAMQDTMENVMNGAQQWWYLTGMSAKSIAPTVVDPTAHVNVQIEAICIQLGCPKRVFMGSERGELASSQDDASWNDRLRHRQDNYISPRILVPFIDRLIMIGVLPPPGETGKQKAEKLATNGFRIQRVRGGYLAKRKYFSRNAEVPAASEKEETKFVASGGYVIEWPDLDSLTDMDRASILSTRTQAYAAYLQSGMEAHVPPKEYMTQFDSMTDEEAEAILESAVAHQEEMMEEQQALDEENQALADEEGFQRSPPDGFERPPEKEPQPPVKLREGERLVKPPEPTENVFCPTGVGGGVDPSCSAEEGGGGGTGHPAIDKALREAKTVPEKVTAIYESSRHFGHITQAGYGKGDAMAKGYLDEALGDASDDDLTKAAAAIGVKGLKGAAAKKEIYASVEERIGATTRSGMTRKESETRSRAQAELEKAGYKRPTENSEEDPDRPFDRPLWHDDIVVFNRFCATGQGGGVDPSCGKEDGSFGTGTKADPFRVGDDIKLAAKLLARGMHVQLNQPEQLSTLTDKLAKIIKKAEKSGEKPPKIDMCKVSVPNTNLFCQESKGIPRVQMPQMRGIPEPNSPADSLARVNKAGKVDIGQDFIDHLEGQGIAVKQESIRASNLRASQNEIDGARVIELLQKVREEGKDLRERPIFVTRDNYVLDGHHHWAALTVLGADKGKDYKVPVYKLDIDIGTGVSEANDFARSMGIKPKTVG